MYINFQLFEDYHTFKKPELEKTSGKTRLSSEIDINLEREPKVRVLQSDISNNLLAQGILPYVGFPESVPLNRVCCIFIMNLGQCQYLHVVQNSL